MDRVGKVLISEEKVQQRVKELGQQLQEEYKGKDLFVLGILKGSVVFLADLIRAIDLPLQVDFMAVSSYGKSTNSSGVVRILKDLDADIRGKDVLIVEDIVDTGLTLSYLLEILNSREPASLKICTFLDKPSRREANIVPDYNGFEIPDEFVVGYGLDYSEKYRNLPYIGVIEFNNN
ncbi:MAG: hypoxanthine phosphoribosyltransferase [Peptococcia bacterium]